MESIKDLVSIYPGVIWEGDYQVQPFVMVGVPSGSNTEGLLETHIGVGALLRSHTVIYWGNKIGQNFQTGHGVLIREENEIGNDVSTGSGTIVEHHVKIGNRVRLHSHVFVPEFSILEDDCWLGPNVVLTNAKYPRSPQVKKKFNWPTYRKIRKNRSECHHTTWCTNRSLCFNRSRRSSDKRCS